MSLKLDEKNLRERIEENLLKFVAVRTDSGAPCERAMEDFFSQWFQQIPYFQEHAEHCGLFPIPEDHLSRRVAWALRKGTGRRTIVMIHHSDCVETSDYSGLEKYCLEPHKLIRAFKDHGEELPPDIEKDLDSGEWLFGRGVADMKGGGAMEMALMEIYCRQPDFQGNVLILSVPDEENLSAGMLGACFLLKELREKWDLDYVLMIDTESHERESPDASVIYDGSVGKIMPVVYVRGKLAHVGQVFSGLNPINLLAEIVRRTELNLYFIERSGNTVTPPATWLYSKDRKEVYDVSLPMDAVGYMSILPLEKTPMDLMDTIKEICVDSFEQVLKGMNESYRIFQMAGGRDPVKLPFKSNVKFFAELYQEAIGDSGRDFADAFQAVYSRVVARLRNKECLVIDAVNELIAVTLKHVKDPYPMVVIALAPPYYPSVNNAKLSGPAAERAGQAIAGVMDYAAKELGRKYSLKNYYTGISDLSYAMFTSGPGNISYIENNMLLWGEFYRIPLDIIQEMSMPVVNIGPWAKDIHKYTERVYKDDLYRVSPLMLHRIICDLLGN